MTFLFTDVEGSTRLWEDHPEEMGAALERHDELVRLAIESNRGYVFSTAGDSFAAAFARATDAVTGAVAAQQSLSDEPWPSPISVRVRMGLHTGEAQERSGDYFGPAVNRAARIMETGSGGQVLVSSACASVLSGDGLLDVGEHRLKDLSALERLYQLGDASFPPLRSLDSVRHNLPVERTPLLGRDDDIDRVANLIGRHRLVTLLGMGGTGKTRLAAAVAADLADQYVDGVWFVDLVPAGGAREVVELVATAVGLQVTGDDPVAALAELLVDRELLIVLDNCEHITDHVADIVDVLLEQTVKPRFVATSREALQVRDERQFQVAPLAIEDGLSSPAVQLFTSTAERVDVGFDVGDTAAIAAICRQLDGLPLSIELAAAQLRHLTLSELADRLDQRFEILVHGRGERRRRQVSLDVVLNDTWNMLESDERELLLQLAAFPATFGVDDVDSVSTQLAVSSPDRALAGLVDRGLVARDGAGRNRLLETVKVFAHRQWATSGQPDAYPERHNQWVLDHLAAYSTQDWHTSFELIGWATRHYEDHRAVEDRLASARRTTDLVRLLSTLPTFYSGVIGPRASAVLDRIDRYLQELPLNDRQRGLLNLVAARAVAQSRQPESLAERSAEAIRLLGHGDGRQDPALAVALIVNSWTMSFRDLDAALVLTDQARAVAESTDAGTIADIALTYRANHLALAQRISEAKATLIEVHTRLGDRPFDDSWYHYYVVSLATDIFEDPSRSHAMGQKLLAELQSHLARSAINWPVFALTSAAAGATGDIEATRSLLAEAQDAVRNTARDDGLPELLLPLAVLASGLGSQDLARRWLTAVESAPGTIHLLWIPIIIKQLRIRVGPPDHDPLDTATIEEIYQEATNRLDAS